MDITNQWMNRSIENLRVKIIELTPLELRPFVSQNVTVRYDEGTAYLDLGKADQLITALDRGWSYPKDARFPVTSEQWNKAMQGLQGAYSKATQETMAEIEKGAVDSYLKEIKRVYKE
jgi:uncharacterized protein YukE